MALYPPAVKMLVPQGTLDDPIQQPEIHPMGVIVHTNASDTSADTLHKAYMPGSGYGGGEAHFDIETHKPPGQRAGRLCQFVDTTIRADNNYRANSYVQGGELRGWISIESGDIGQPYTANFTALGQRKQLVDLLVWICRTHNIPAVRATDPFGYGIGWHCMWGFNYYGPGDGKYGHYNDGGRNLRIDNPWTNTAGKICPGPAPGTPGGKIGEMPSIIAEVYSILHPDPPVPQPPMLIEEEDMPQIIQVTDGGDAGHWLIVPGQNPLKALTITEIAGWRSVKVVDPQKLLPVGSPDRNASMIQAYPEGAVTGATWARMKVTFTPRGT